MRCREGILLELVERLQAKVVTQLFPKAVTKLFPKAVTKAVTQLSPKVFTKAFLQLVLEVFPPKVIPKCATFLPGHHPAWFVICDAKNLCDIYVIHII